MPYEFLNIGGKKMSTSKGTGATAHAMAETLPPELLRFLFLRHKPRKAIEFDPEGDAIPGLFDEFDRIAGAVAGREVRGELPPDPERIFRASLVTEPEDLVAEAARFRPAFRHLALLVQVPGVDLDARIEAENGAPLDAGERAILDQRVAVARSWLTEFAPDRYRVEVRSDGLPAEASELEAAQRAYLAASLMPRPLSARRPATPGRTSSSARPRRASCLGTGVRGHLPRVPRPTQRTPRRLVAGGLVESGTRLRAAAVQVGSPPMSDVPSAEVGA